MSALVPWITTTFGSLGGALVGVGLLILVGVVVRYLFEDNSESYGTGPLAGQVRRTRLGHASGQQRLGPC